MKMKIESYLDSVSDNFKNLKIASSNIENAAKTTINALQNNNKIIFCGNGGSAADSQHLAAELMGRYKLDRAPLPAIAITVDTSALTAIANDYGYENIFSRQLNGIGVKGDVLFAISTSGKSKSIIKAIKTAKDIGMQVISLTGSTIGEMNEMSDICINTPSIETNHIQEMHITIGQLICGLVEEELFNK
tara:strand:+ start:14405 stop:14974 length:570 start_codon:yes stop_codon:yes gene_type:complete